MNTTEISEALDFIGFDDDENRQYHCPFCHDVVTVRKDVFFGQCKACKSTLIDYKPLPHQVEFHKSNALYRLLMGG